jgi:hypothetical protein
MDRVYKTLDCAIAEKSLMSPRATFGVRLARCQGDLIILVNQNIACGRSLASTSVLSGLPDCHLLDCIAPA